MSTHDINMRLGNIERELSRNTTELAEIKAMLKERCQQRGERLDDMEGEINYLKKHEHQRQGKEKILFIGLGAASAIISGIISYAGKLFNNG